MDVPRLIVLRVWNLPSAFRAVVRDVGPERTATFSDPDALLRYLLGGEARAGGPGGREPPTASGGQTPMSHRTPRDDT